MGSPMKHLFGTIVTPLALLVALTACESSEPQVLYAQCETYVAVFTGWCVRCNSLSAEDCEEIARGTNGDPSDYCIGLRPQEDNIESNYFDDCLQPLDSLACGESVPSVCTLVYDKDLAEKQGEE